MKLHNVSAEQVATRGTEGYILDVASRSALLVSQAAPGALYGAQTLLQLLNATASGLAEGMVHPTFIADAPDSPVRGLYLFTHQSLVCTEAYLKQAADAMVSLKLNTAIVTSGYFSAIDNDGSGYCSRADLQAGHAYMRARHINVVPQLTAGNTNDLQLNASKMGPDVADGVWARNEPFIVDATGHNLVPVHTDNTVIAISFRPAPSPSPSYPLLTSTLTTPGAPLCDRPAPQRRLRVPERQWPTGGLGPVWPSVSRGQQHGPSGAAAEHEV